MGEPLNNYTALVEAIRAMTGPPFQLSPKRITVSTVIPPKSKFFNCCCRHFFVAIFAIAFNFSTSFTHLSLDTAFIFFLQRVKSTKKMILNLRKNSFPVFAIDWLWIIMLFYVIKIW